MRKGSTDGHSELSAAHRQGCIQHLRSGNVFDEGLQGRLPPTELLCDVLQKSGPPVARPRVLQGVTRKLVQFQVALKWRRL